MINRYELVSRHNPVLQAVDYNSPLSVGNGEFAYTVDVTGMQTLYEEYKEHNNPLCTMSQWGWHSCRARTDLEAFSMQDLLMTSYDYEGREVTYAVEMKSGNEEVYQWLRHNPHRIHLGSVGFVWEGKDICADDVEQIHQELKLYEGVIVSCFTLHGVAVRVTTCCHSKKDMFGLQIDSPALEDGRLQIRCRFSYGASNITGADWESLEKHRTVVVSQSEKQVVLSRYMDAMEYSVGICSEQTFSIEKIDHTVCLRANSPSFSLTVAFKKEKEKRESLCCTQNEVYLDSCRYWKTFWETGGAVELYRSKDPRGMELERRIVLSQYLLAIQSCGSLPPQETGLTCNSWYGKFHLEMHLWHSAWLPLWGRSALLQRSLPWYKEHLEEAKKNAQRNGFKGAKWPKMVADSGIDSPSEIATLLIWQQPHIIYMLALIYQTEQSPDLLTEYWDVVRETAVYMADITVYNKTTGKYDLPSPIIPVQEVHNPRTTKNPAFELQYWHIVLGIAYEWALKLGHKEYREWNIISDSMAELSVKNNLYLAHENCPDTFTLYHKDHPSMLGAMGLLPGKRIDSSVMKNTLDNVQKCWDYTSMWGWDFAMMAMTAVRLSEQEMAIDILLKDTPKNSYEISGNNNQKLRTDLPLYLPGNGALLLAIPIMTAGYPGCEETLPGFPKNGMWEVVYEDISPFLY